MIITQTPLRVSFAGGGTDFPAFFEREEGCVISSTIDKYVYVIIKERFDNKIRIGYSRTEMVDHLDEVAHDLVRECLRRTRIGHGIEIATMADIPSEGSGLGSSSSVTFSRPAARAASTVSSRATASNDAGTVRMMSCRSSRFSSTSRAIRWFHASQRCLR